MFQPETDDMLPRMAPKPSADVPCGGGDGIIRPQVPEVSILYGQQKPELQHNTFNTTSQQQNKNVQQPTYAIWKKQILPKVTYPSSSNMVETHLPENMHHGYNGAFANFYPIPSNTNPQLYIGSNVNTNAFGINNGSGAVDSQMQYRRTLETSNNKAYAQIQNIATLQPTLTRLPNITPLEVLTLCAGTQTDPHLEPYNQSEYLSNLASKGDIENVRQIVNELKYEQQRMLKMLEAVLLTHQSQSPVKIQFRDIGVQVDLKDIHNLDYGDNRSEHNQQVILKNKFLHHLKPNTILQTPKCNPVAQSTTYRPNSLQPFIQNCPALVNSPINQQLSKKPISTISKSASDTSLAMNELALKYLPHEKLAELLNELNMDCPLGTAATTPDRINIEKRPSDVSNASYKYLKKYRLLPEDHESERIIENYKENQEVHYNSPQCHRIRKPTNNQRFTPTNRCSPHADHLPLSPLARGLSPPLQPIEPQLIVNLENIKHQPKLL